MDTQILSPTPATLQHLADHLRSGGLVAIPTETVYGLAGHALDPQPITQIFAVKERPTFDPLITHVAQPDVGYPYLEYLERDLGLVDLSGFEGSQRQSLADLLQTWWPGPLTVVLPRTSRVPDLVSSGLPTVALRMPRHPIAQQVLDRAQIPLAAPSANRFGRISPTSAQAVLSELEGRIPYILDGGECEIGLESTVILVDPREGITLLRPGGISLEQICQSTSMLTRVARSTKGLPTSPGQLPSHYAPGKPFLMLPSRLADLTGPDLKAMLTEQKDYGKLGVLLFSSQSEPIVASLQDYLGVQIEVEILSSSGDLEEAARTLFAKLRRLDCSDADVLLTEPCPVLTGLGHAIQDRLHRATANRQ